MFSSLAVVCNPVGRTPGAVFNSSYLFLLNKTVYGWKDDLMRQYCIYRDCGFEEFNKD